MKLITLQITTRNRYNDLVISLSKNESFINDSRVHTIICIDGKDVKLSEYISMRYPNAVLIVNEFPKGYIHNRNFMMKQTTTPFAVSLDDDAHFLSTQSVDLILEYFNNHDKCAVIAFRIYWGKDEMSFIPAADKPCRVRGYVGCGHAWRMAHWNEISPYPEWFIFYGEEEYAGYKLFKHGREIHYVPEIFIQHRVILTERKIQKDGIYRNRRSLSSGWYLWLLFVPKNKWPKYFAGSILNQIGKVIKGNWKVIAVILFSFYDLVMNLNMIKSYRNRLNQEEYKDYLKVLPTIIYWKPE